MAELDGGGRVGRSAFAALPVPAALVDAAGRVAQVNPAWRECQEVYAALMTAADFATGWAAVSDDSFVAEALTSAVRTRTPAQLETTTHGQPPHRMLVQMGPTDLGEPPGVLVVLVDITEQYERERQLMFEATHDSLTGVANRARLQQAVGEALARLRRYGSAFALIYLDLDEFKPLNDRYGHAVGDQLLQDVATRWQQVVRDPDVLARVGGDEFVVLVQHLDESNDVTALAARLTAALARPFTSNALRIQLAVTAGVAFPPGDVTADGAVALADQAMYRQKKRQIRLRADPHVPVIPQG
jgi:diguanylate cyclase (GGDEF)-like protein